MGVEHFKNQIFVKPRGKNKNKYYKLIYNSGSYAELQIIENNIIIHSKSILINSSQGYDINQYVLENNYIKQD